MGMWVILIGGRDFSLSRFSSMKFCGSTEIIQYDHGHQLTVLYGEERAYFYDDDGGYIRSDYSSEELSRLPFDDPVMVMLHFSAVEVLQRIVGYDDFPEDCLIDCDGVPFGLESIIPAERLIGLDEEM